MIANTELHSKMRSSRFRISRPRALPAGLERDVAFFIVLLAVIIVLQIASGAYRSEFSTYPDEPAHYVTSLMVREYLTSGHLLHPMAFAQNYYAHYPKVAFGHWPPVFYIVQAGWMLLFSASRVSVRLELAFTTAVLAFSLYWEAKRYFGTWAARLAALLLVCVPLIQTCTDQEMSEALLTLFCFWAAVFFARYLQSERWKDNLWFGVFLSLAVLTKGNGWLLCLVPPIAMPLARKLHLLLRPVFWIAPAVVAVLCLPWQIMTMDLASEGWTNGTTPTVHYTADALHEFGLILIGIVGPALAALALIGIAAQVIEPLVRRKRVAPFPAVMLALIVATWIFHSLIPAGVEERKMVMAVPALLLFVIPGGFWLADHLPLGAALARWRRALVALAVGAVFAGVTFAIPRDHPYGYTQAARFITSRADFRGARILTSSNSIGEGLLVSEVAMLQPRPQHTIVRATKVLVHMNWNGSVYQPLVRSPQDVLSVLRRERVSLVVTDTWPLSSELPHNALLRKTIAEDPSRFQLLATCVPGGQAVAPQVRIYRFLP